MFSCVIKVCPVLNGIYHMVALQLATVCNEVQLTSYQNCEAATDVEQSGLQLHDIILPMAILHDMSPKFSNQYLVLHHYTMQ